MDRDEILKDLLKQKTKWLKDHAADLALKHELVEALKEIHNGAHQTPCKGCILVIRAEKTL